MSGFISPLHNTVYNSKNGEGGDGDVSDHQCKLLSKVRVISPQSNR